MAEQKSPKLLARVRFLLPVPVFFRMENLDNFKDILFLHSFSQLMMNFIDSNSTEFIKINPI